MQLDQAFPAQPGTANGTVTPIGARLSSKNLSQKHLCCPLSQGRGSWKALCHKPSSLSWRL